MYTGLHVGVYIDAEAVGGAERSTLAVAMAAGDLGVRFSILVTSPTVLAEARRIVPAAACSLLDGHSGAIRSGRRLRRALRSSGVDLLHVSMNNSFASPLPLLVARSLRLPTVAVEHLVMSSRRRRGAVLKRLTTTLVDELVAVGRASARDLQRFFGIPSDSITVIHNGVDLDPVDAVTSRVSTEYPFTIGCAARLEAQKGLDALIDALDRLPDCSLLLIGDGSLRAELERRAAVLGIGERVEVTGWVDDARPLVAGLDVFVLPSRNEAFPLTILEAMVQGVPVVAADVGSVSEAVIDGRTGSLVPPGDVGDLTTAIRRVLDDQAMRDRTVAAAHELVRNRYGIGTTAQEYAQLWERVSRCRRAIRPARSRSADRGPGRAS